MISIQRDDFDVGKEYHELAENNVNDGAIVFFVGQVRDYNQGSSVHGLSLEHYPGMTEKALLDIVEEAHKRWSLGQIKIVHRIGCLSLGEQIVFVGVTSKHREASFEAAQFIMDYLKNSAPFWKKEITDEGERWVEQELKDQVAKQRW
jgi:molybdopterin synthase catalytic subunit